MHNAGHYHLFLIWGVSSSLAVFSGSAYVATAGYRDATAAEKAAASINPAAANGNMEKAVPA
jgi:hypothetical protein